MIPKENARGHSFKGIAVYLMNHTPEMKPGENRVSWSATENLMDCRDISLAARIMAGTDMNGDYLKEQAGIRKGGAQKTAGAVYHYSLAWAQGETPDQEHMQQQVSATIDRLGLSEHQYFMVAHADRPHAHVHVVANLTHPETGLRADPGLSKRKLQAWALEYERETGMHCLMREENAGKGIKHQAHKQGYVTEVTRAWYAADNGQSFKAALEAEGLTLARAKRGKGYVLINDKGEIQALTRQLEIEQKNKQKTAAINHKLADLKAEEIPDGDEAAKHIRAINEQAMRDSDDTARQNDMLDAADNHAQKVAAADERKERIEAEINTRLEQVQIRQAQETQDLEERIKASIGAKLDLLRQEADQMQGIVEGSGFRLGLRRLWRGKKDRAALAEMRDEIEALKAGMDKARDDLAQIHEGETGDIRRLYMEGERPGFADLEADTQLDILERMQKRPDQYGPSQMMEQRRKQRLIEQGQRIRDREAARQKEAETQRQMLVDRIRFEDRNREQDTASPAPDHSPERQQSDKSDRLRQSLEDIRSRKIDKGPDYEP